mgnify:CR=1 FL=1
MVILISSLTLRSKRPLSGSDRVTCLIISSKHWEKSSSLTGQIPLSLACLSISFWSSISLSLATSTLEAGWWLTYWMKCFPDSTHSLGGRIALRISSLLGLVSIGGNCCFLAPIKWKMRGKYDIWISERSTLLDTIKNNASWLLWISSFDVVLTKTLLEWVHFVSSWDLKPSKHICKYKVQSTYKELTSIGFSYCTRLSLGLPSIIFDFIF